MSETARRKIELVVEVNIEQSKRALATVTSDADKAAKDIARAAAKGAKTEVDIAIDKARQIARINAGLDRQRAAAYKAAEREAADAARKELSEAKKRAADLVRIAAMAEREKAKNAREAAQAAKQVERDRAQAVRESVAAQQAALRELAQNEKQAEREAKEAAASEKAAAAQKKKDYGDLGDVLKMLGAAYTAMYVANTALDWAKEGAQIRGLSKSYEHIGFTAKDLDATMAKLGYTLDQATVQRMSNLAHSFNFGQKEIQRFAEIARAASVKTGQDIKWMFESIVTGTARQSRLILDNLGILIKVGDANEKYAKKLGIHVDKLTDVQRKQAFVNEVMIQGEKIIKDAPLDPLSQKIGRVASAWKEAGNAAKVAFAVMAGGVIEAATGNYASENLSRLEQQKANWREQYRARRELEAGGADSIYGYTGDPIADRQKLDMLADLAEATIELRTKVVNAVHSDYESVRAEAAAELLAKLKQVEDLNWKSIGTAENAGRIQKEQLQYLMREEELRAKVAELKGDGLDKQEQETKELATAVNDLNSLVEARIIYNGLLRRGIGAVSPGADEQGGEPGSPGDPNGARAYVPQAAGGAAWRAGGGNDPDSPGVPGDYIDNAAAQRGARMVGEESTTYDQAQQQHKTKKRGGGRKTNDRGMDLLLPSVLESDERFNFSEFEMASNKVRGIYEKTYQAIADKEKEIFEQSQTRRQQEIAAAYEENKRELFGGETKKKDPTLLDHLMDDAGPVRYGMQADLDAGRYSSKGKEADMAARDAAMQQLTPDDRQAFEEERLKVWQTGASEAEFAWANFMDDAEPDRLKAIGDAIHDNIAKPTQIAADALKDLAEGFSESAVAAIYEAKGLAAWKRATNEMLKQLSRQAAAKAIYEGAAALGSLAIQDYPGAVLHGKAAAAYGIVAVGFGVGAAATGGWQTHQAKDKAEDKKDKGGPAARTGNDGRMMQQISNVYYISYSGLQSDAAVRRMLMDTLNSGVGSGDRLDSRVIEQR